jgi:hypothetical protein
MLAKAKAKAKAKGVWIATSWNSEAEAKSSHSTAELHKAIEWLEIQLPSNRRIKLSFVPARLLSLAV